MRMWIALPLLLAGCLGTQTATLDIDYASQGQPVHASIEFDPDSRPAQALYDAKGATHPGYYHVVDLLEDWSAHGHHSVSYQYFPDFGLSVEAIDGVQGTFENGWWWAFYMDGEPVCDAGISTTAVEAGHAVSFRLVTADTNLCGS